LSYIYKYKYNGKEYQDELGLNTYDYGARFYYPATGRWFSMDAMAEKYSDLSPYNYVLNNPVIYVDPDGNEVEMCCDGLKGFLVGVFDNLLGRNDRSNYGGSDFNNGARLADVVSVLGGSMLTGKGLADITAGTTGLNASVAVTAGTGGLAIEVTAPAAAASGALIGIGAVEVKAGSNIVSNAMSNLKNGNSSGKSGTGRGSNNRTADDNAVGDHTVRNENGHTTYKSELNNPNKNSQGVGFKTEKRVDYKGAAHVDKKTGIKIETRHVQENGTTRPAIPGKDMPKN
jgi:RHS repeat-associated protein